MEHTIENFEEVLKENSEFKAALDKANQRADRAEQRAELAERQLEQAEQKIEQTNQRAEKAEQQLEQANRRLEQMAKNQEDFLGLIAALQNEVAELKAQLNQNSKNSSKPPSSDGYKKAKAQPKKKTGRKPGGQKGHKGKTLKFDLEPDAVISHLPERCLGCEKYGQCRLKAKRVERRYELDVDINVKCTAHDLMEVVSCPFDQQNYRGNFPETITGRFQYGGGIKALAVALNTYGAVSVDRVHDLLSSVFGVPISTGTVQNMVHETAQNLEPFMEELKDVLIKRDVLHYDETGLRVSGKNDWVHTASTPEESYLCVAGGRSTQSMIDVGILPKFNGKLIHDCYASYFKFDKVIHGLCGAHLIRELNGISENYPENTWAGELRELILELKKQKDQAISQGLNCLKEEELLDFQEKSHDLIETGLLQNPVLDDKPKKRGRKKKTKARNLLERIEKHFDDFFRFAHDFTVPFSNNCAERSLRPLKVKGKVAGCFRTKQGAQDYCNILSYIQTAKKRGLNVFNTLKAAVCGQPLFA